MESILLQLYKGELEPMEHLKPMLEEYEKKCTKLRDSDQRFMNKLNDTQRKEFEYLMGEHLDLLPAELSQAFIDGFRLGVRLMCETLYGGGGAPSDRTLTPGER